VRRTPARFAAAALAAAALAGCDTVTKVEVTPYEAPAAGPLARLTVRTDRMWLTNRVTVVLLRAGEAAGAPRTVRRLGQLQSGEYVRREVLSFDTMLPAGVPLWLHFEYRYDAGSSFETGCDFPLQLTLRADSSYLIDFIKDSVSCAPRLYLREADGRLTELAVGKP
jgi:hypothetical protein